MADPVNLTENQQKIIGVLSQPLTPFLTAEEIVLELNRTAVDYECYSTGHLGGSLGGLRKKKLLLIKRAIRKDLKQEWIPARAAGVPQIGGMVKVYMRKNHWCLPENVPVAQGIIKYRKQEIRRKENEQNKIT